MANETPMRYTCVYFHPVKKEYAKVRVNQITMVKHGFWIDGDGEWCPAATYAELWIPQHNVQFVYNEQYKKIRKLAAGS